MFHAFTLALHKKVIDYVRGQLLVNEQARSCVFVIIGPLVMLLSQGTAGKLESNKRQIERLASKLDQCFGGEHDTQRHSLWN